MKQNLFRGVGFEDYEVRFWEVRKDHEQQNEDLRTSNEGPRVRRA